MYIYSLLKIIPIHYEHTLVLFELLNATVFEILNATISMFYLYCFLN